MLLAGGHIRPGDRLRWSFASIGLTVGPSERSDAMPVRWAGVMGSIVVLNLAVALRGLSDRWTHGLPPMADADRVVAMSAALLLIVGWPGDAAPPASPPNRGTATCLGGARNDQPARPRSARPRSPGSSASSPGSSPGPSTPLTASPSIVNNGPRCNSIVDEVDPDATEIGNGLVRGAEMTAQRPNEP